MIRRRFQVSELGDTIVLEGLRLEGEPLRVALGVDVAKGRYIDVRIMQSQDRVNWSQVQEDRLLRGIWTFCVAAASRWIRVIVGTTRGARTEGEIIAHGVREDSGEGRDAG